MRKRIILLTSMILVLSFQICNAQSKTRLIGYENVRLDTLGRATINNAYWQNFSGNRGSVITHPVRVGLTEYTYFLDGSSADTTWAIDHNSSIHADSSMTVRVYSSNNDLLGSRKYSWDFNTSSWTSYAVAVDTFIYSANRLIASYHVEHSTAVDSFNGQRNVYTYNANGQLLSNVITYQSGDISKAEYAWSGNDMTSETYYTFTSGSWQLETKYSAIYNNQKLLTQRYNRWTYGSLGTLIYNEYYDSNVYKGNILTDRFGRYAGLIYGLYSGPFMGKYPFNIHWNFQYDSKGNLAVMTSEIIDSLGVWHKLLKTDYTYNNDNNPEVVKYSDYDSIANKWKLPRSATYYHYYPFPTTVEGAKYENQLSLYPSPAQNIIHLKTYFAKTMECNFVIIDMQGRLVRQWNEIIATGTNETTISTEDLPTGMYWLKLSSSSGVVIKGFNIVK
ncbi:MAG: T9SS type A sorting domain-containing protein [Bacteroidetes bacterium]|nr:T9SS type A sorting domain-containing protein [Bacteroidota bacterium]